MSDFQSVDFFTDASLIPDRYPYFDHLRAHCPMSPPRHGVGAVTGHNEALAVYKDPHVAFGRGSCPGAPLARAEGRISFNRILDRMSDITISETAIR